jgi:circadian clock protein KaiB
LIILAVLEDKLRGKYELEVVDVSKDPKSLREENVITLPTLIKKLPLPVRHIIGNMSNKEKVLVGLDLVPRKKSLGILEAQQSGHACWRLVEKG